MYIHIHTHSLFKLSLLICTRWRYTERVCKDCLLTIAVFVVELMMYSSFGTAGTTSKLYTHASTRTHTHTDVKFVERGSAVFEDQLLPPTK